MPSTDLMEFKLCPACRGKRETLSAGMIKLEKCNTCSGVGSIEIKTEESPLPEPTVIEKPKRKYDRKSSASTEQ